MRKYVSRRLPSEGEIAALMTTMRRQSSTISKKRNGQSLETPSAQIKVDEKLIRDDRVARISATSTLSKHAAVAGWKQRAVSFVEQEGAERMQGGRSAAQGDVDDLTECSLA